MFYWKSRKAISASEPVFGIISFLKIFWNVPFFKSLYWICYNIVCLFVCLFCIFLAHKAYGILVSGPGVEPTFPVVYGKILTTVPSEKSLGILLYILKFEVIFQNLLSAFFPVLAIRFQGFLISCYCCTVTKLCPTLCDPMNCSTRGFPVLHYLLESAQTQAHSWTVIDLKHSELKVFIYQLVFGIFVYWTHYNIYDNFMPEFPSKAAENFSLFSNVFTWFTPLH